MSLQRARAWMVVSVVVLLPALMSASETRAVTRQLAPRARTTWDSVYSADQAAHGETTYAKTCSRCHQASLGGADEAPALTGGAFMGTWNGQTLHDLHDRVRATMPTDTPGTYSRQDISDVLAYLLKFNQFPAGKLPLPATEEELKGIMFVSTKPAPK